MPIAGIADDHLDVRVDALEPHLHPAALGRELHGVRHQVPQDLLQAIGIARHWPDARIERRSAARTPFASAAGCTVVDRVVDTTAGRSTACTFRRILPETMRETSSTSSTIWVSELALRSSVSNARASASRRQQAASHQPRVADDGVQRRAQLVREHREELVLQPAGVLGVRQQPRVLPRLAAGSLMSRAIFDAPITSPASS